ncbi:P-loop ATPase, Sll1717 family [Paucibacter sp. B51]|uniref:P-loop ATPase, Sll1717 family n=1 Tax=Paucibacter sp. B51 TaxID=2993315 RepID=UPI0022EBB900|nr:DNA repair protein [Paucibacter sp. B51]
MSVKPASLQFRFRKGASIGEPDAESDDRFISSCFVDTGDYEVLADCSTSQRIIVGRTGAGKSALMRHIKASQEHVIEIQPENLSLNFISNSDILQTLAKSGVKLDLFYSLLWKHVFTVELLRNKFNLSSEERTRNWISNFLPSLRKTDQAKERALNYLKNWGDRFWEETEYRIKEVTNKLECEVKSQIGADIKYLNTGISAHEKGAQEIRADVIHRAQRVINGIQIKELSDVIQLLADEIFNDPQAKQYILIDRLDENWVDDELRYRLIRSLIDTIKHLRVLSNVKIIVALRVDLLESVFEKTRDSGFQEEKYRALFLRLAWSKEHLGQLLDRRVAQLCREQYTSNGLKLADIFPEMIGGMPILDHILQRTLYRPRDAIAFVNECLRRSEGKGVVSVQTVREAEREYSAQRLDSLCYEWFNHFPGLKKYLGLLERLPHKFKLSAISKEAVEEFSLRHCIDTEHPTDPVIDAGRTFINSPGASAHAFVVVLTKVLFTVGAIGIKSDGFSSEAWNFSSERPPSDGQIKPSSTAFVHPMLWGSLGTVVA